MNLKQIIKTTIAFVILAQNVYAQESSTAQEPIVTINNEITENPSPTSPKSDYKENSLVQQAREGLASSLLGKDKPKSLMFDDQEYDNLENAIESLKNNETYIPDGSDSDKILSEEERKKSEEAEKLRKQEQENQENEKSYIYLASIIYFNSKDWIVWVNDKKITSKTNDPKKELYVEKITKGSVTVLWKLSLSKWKIISGKKEEFAPKTNAENQIEIRFDLKPNQTFTLSSGKVVEGKALINLQKKKEESESIVAPKP